MKQTVLSRLRKNAQRGVSAAAMLTLLVPTALVVWPAPQAQAAVSDWQQKGISFYPKSPNDFDSDGFRQSVDHFQSLGMNTITLVIQLSQSDIHSTDIGPAGNNPTDAALTSAIQYVRSKGMKVMLKVHLDSRDGQWRARISPNDRSTWYANYLSELKHYGQIAETNGVEYYCIGTELIDMASPKINPDNTSEWQHMISQVRQIYHGKLTYDANWGSSTTDGEARFIEFWPSLDFISISAYYPLYGDGSLAQDKSAWDMWRNDEIQPLENKYNKPVIFTEVGYRSAPDSYKHPYDSWSGGGYDPQEQVRDYQALFQYWNSYSYMQGIDIWYAIADPNSGGSGDTDYLINNKPVEQTIKQWFQGSGTSTPSGAPAKFTVSGSADPSAIQTNQQTTLTANVQDTGGDSWGTIIDLEVYDSSNKKVAQHITDHQDISASSTKQYTLNWTPKSAGAYTFKVGVFDSNWKLYTWDNSAAKITVTDGSSGGSTGGGSTGGNTGGSGTGTSTPSGSKTTDIWWPTDGKTVSGTQPFKAMLESTPLSAYAMYWQVDGGQLNGMHDSQTDYPHKEALVNLKNWNWKGKGPYTINFVSKDSNGKVISSKSINIYIAH